MTKQQTILIVEDDKRIVDLIKSAVGKIGQHYIIKQAYNGKEALEIIEAEHIDLALLDIIMPVMSGAQLLTELCNRKIWLPIVIVTGYGINEIQNKLLDFGVIDILLKPFNLSDLKTKIEDILKRSEHKDSISGMSLPAIMQVLEMERRTGIMTVKTNHKTARIFFKKGKVVDMEAEGDIGEEILAEFLDYTGTEKEINIEYLSHKRKEKLDKTLTEVLFEVSKFLDEKKGQILITSKQPAQIQWEAPIDYGRFNALIENLKTDIGEGLLSTGIWTYPGSRVIVGYNWREEVSELFTQISLYARDALLKAEYPEFGRYFLFDLDGGKVSLTISLPKFSWGMLLDSRKTSLEFILKVILPEKIASLETLH
ncbi:MAG: response regulator [Candidatus Omnitrophota bacterium]